MNKGVFLALLYFFGLAAIFVLMVFLLSPFLSALAWAGILGLAAYPVHRFFLRLFRGRKNLAAVFSTTAVALVIIVPLLVLAILFTNQAIGVVGDLQSYVASGHIPGREEILAKPMVKKALEPIEPYIKDVDLKPLVLTTMKSASTFAVMISKAFFKNAAGGVFKFFIMCAVLFFAFRDGESMARSMWESIPIKEEDKAVIIDATKRVVNAVLYGVVLTCIAQGVLGGIGFALVGIKAAVFLGAVMMVCAFIPVVGTSLVWVPTVIYLLMVGRYGAALFLTIWCVAVVSSVDNFVRPYFISGKSKIPLLVILLGALGGLATMGFLGVILGPLLFTVSMEVFRVYKVEIMSPVAAAAGGSTIRPRGNSGLVEPEESPDNTPPEGS